MALVLGGVTFEAVRRRKLRERYSILWFFTSFAILLASIFPSMPDYIARLLGLSFAEASLYLFSIALIFIIFYVSVALSKNKSDQDAQARYCANLRADVEELANRLKKIEDQKYKDNI